MFLTRSDGRKIYPYLLILSLLFVALPFRHTYLSVLYLVSFDEAFRTLWEIFYGDSMTSFVGGNLIYGCIYGKTWVSFLSFFVFGFIFSISGKDYSLLEMYLFRLILYIHFTNSSS